MRSRKFFILTLLTLLHFSSANAMEKEQENDLIGNIRSIKVADRPDITYDGRIGFGGGYQDLELYKLWGTVTTIKNVKDYFVYSDEDVKTYKRRTSTRLYDLCFTRWEREAATRECKKGLIVIWELLPTSSIKTNSKDSCKKRYAEMRKESYSKSLKKLLIHLKQDNNVYYYESDPPSLKQNLKVTCEWIGEIWYQNGSVGGI